MAGPDPSLEDATALEEINLYADLVIAATSSSTRLPTAEIDRLLGLQPPQAAPPPPTAGTAAAAASS